MVAHIPLDRRANFPALKHHSFTRLTRSLVLIWKDTTDGLESWRTFSTMLEVPMLKHSNGSSLIRLADCGGVVGKTTLITGLFLGMPPWLRLMERSVLQAGSFGHKDHKGSMDSVKRGYQGRPAIAWGLQGWPG